MWRQCDVWCVQVSSACHLLSSSCSLHFFFHFGFAPLCNWAEIFPGNFRSSAFLPLSNHVFSFDGCCLMSFLTPVECLRFHLAWGFMAPLLALLDAAQKLFWPLTSKEICLWVLFFPSLSVLPSCSLNMFSRTFLEVDEQVEYILSTCLILCKLQGRQALHLFV